MSSVHASGPLFDGEARRRLAQLPRDIEDAVAGRATNLIHERLHQVLRHPTGYYEAHIRTDRVSAGVSVNDDRVIYGPWLEGVGSRNSPVTRFPGYFTFRTVGGIVDRSASGWARPVVERFVREVS